MDENDIFNLWGIFGADEIPTQPPLEDFQITKNFKFFEFLVTNTGKPNRPNDEQIENIKKTAKAIQPIRDKVGKIQVISGYRSPEVQAALTGSGNVQVSKKSLHMEGMAADIVPQEMSAEKVFATIASDPKLYNSLGEIALKNTCLHISIPTPTKQGYFMEVINNVYYGMSADRVKEIVNKYVAVIKEYKKTSIGVALALMSGLGFGTFLLIKKLRK